jgi:hypothetical protein
MRDNAALKDLSEHPGTAPTVAAKAWPTKKLAIFGPRTEKLILYFPIFFILLIPLEFAGLWTINSGEKRWLRVFSDILFLGTIHSVLSLTLMLFIPEVRDWFKTYGGGSMSKAILKFAIVCALIFSFMFYTVVKDSKTDPVFLLIAVVLIHSILGQRHWVRQAQGMSLLYNSRLRQALSLDGITQAKMAGIERSEKFGFTLLTIATALISIALSNVLVSLIPQLKMRPLIPVFAVLGFFGAGLVIYCSWITPHASRTNKFFFNLRSLLVTFHSLSLSANLGMRATHGLEFLALTGKMSANSRISKKMLIGFIVASVFAICFAAMVDLAKSALFMKHLWTNYPGYFTVWCFMASIDLTFTYVHYYTDAVMFRFKDEGVRKSIAPLLR